MQSVLGSAVVEEFEEVEVSVDALDGTDLAVERNDGNEIGDRCRLRGANSDDEHTFRRRQQGVVERGGVELDTGAKVVLQSDIQRNSEGGNTHLFDRVSVDAASGHRRENWSMAKKRLWRFETSYHDLSVSNIVECENDEPVDVESRSEAAFETDFKTLNP